MRYIADDCFSDGIFLAETDAEVAEANRLNACLRKESERVRERLWQERLWQAIIWTAAFGTAFVIGTASR